MTPIAPPTAVQVHRLDVHIDGNPVLREVDIAAPQGAITAIIGPNGSGKSTLLRAIYRAVRPKSGAILIGETDVWRSRAKAVARLRAVVTQHQGDAADFTVREVVAMGRGPHLHYLSVRSQRDDSIVDSAMERIAISGFADRPFASLSGGERQRVLLARALAQEAPVILLDEPTNHLDAHAQLELLHLLDDLPATIVIAIHDLGQALAFANHAIALDHGRLIASGRPGDVITPDLMQTVFGLKATVGTNPLTGRPHLFVDLPA